MVRMKFKRTMPDKARKYTATQDLKKNFSPESVLAEHLQSLRRIEPESSKTQNTEKISKTTNKILRWAVLSTPFIMACSQVTDNEKMHAGNISLATIGGIAVTLGILCAGVSGVNAFVKHIKNKKEN